jgi:hypothetical protein
MTADGELISIRWATQERNYDPRWGKWHLIKAGGAFTFCGQVVRLFEVDGSPQEGNLEAITCRHCLRILGGIAK